MKSSKSAEENVTQDAGRLIGQEGGVLSDGISKNKKGN